MTIELTILHGDIVAERHSCRWIRAVDARAVLDVAYRIAAGTALLLLLPLLVVLTVAVLATGPGAPIFRQRRVGLEGREFTIWKFRSMRCDAERVLHVVLPFNERNGPVFKIRCDPRVTRLGAFLRRTSLDELPQLWNIVRGEMSLVGPRPALPEEVVRYTALERRRLSVKPGLTGLWQVRGRSDLSWEESIRLDVEYVEHWSLGLETAVLLATPRAVFSTRGAY